jgi:hypothetical protein
MSGSTSLAPNIEKLRAFPEMSPNWRNFFGPSNDIRRSETLTLYNTKDVCFGVKRSTRDF